MTQLIKADDQQINELAKLLNIQIFNILLFMDQ